MKLILTCKENEFLKDENVADQKEGEFMKAICDVCNFDIVDVRFKCLNCLDYDVCKYCEEKLLTLKPHNMQHVFAKLERPKIGKFYFYLYKHRFFFLNFHFFNFSLGSVKCHLPNLYTGKYEDESETSNMSDELIWSLRKNSVKGLG
jgi:hypothetical protein